MTSRVPLRITVLRDDPLFEKLPYESASDTFAYEAFAKALLDVLENNPPPISIGLFGPWGIGKSTIVNILFNKIRSDTTSRLFPIYFNAWKYSGDSFRRQFLLEVATAVYGGRAHKQVQRLECLNYTDVLVEKPDGSWLDELKEILTGKVIRARRSGLIRIILGVFLLAMGIGFSILSKSSYPTVVGLFAAITLFVLKMKFEDVFVIEENRVFDPKLIFPEQFEQEFRKLVDSSSLDGRRAVIVIDDIDRCESSTIKDILISTKNFVGHTNAYFLIPCDDLNVINVFEDPAHQVGYRDEMLRKYFNVGLRVPPISNRDLIDFANRMARETKLPEEIVQLAVIADYRDARRIKHFANNFLLKLHIARARSVSGFLPELTSDRELQLAKLVIIEDCAPPIFARLVQNPTLLPLLEASAVSPDSGRAQLREYNLERWDTDFPGLKKALVGARYVTISDLEVLLSLKADNLELKVPSGAQFRTALLQGATDQLASQLPEIAARNTQQALADLICDSLRRATGPLLANCIAATLSLPIKAFFVLDDAGRVVRQLNLALLRDDQRVWVQSTPKVMDIADMFEFQLARQLLNKYVSELKGMVEQPSNLVETVTLVYHRLDEKGPIVDVLNDRLLAWSTSEMGLSAILALLQENLSVADHVFPSRDVLSALIKGFNPMAGDLKANELRKEILFANWHSDFNQAVSSILWAVIQQQHSVSAFDPPLRLTLHTLFEKPEILQNPESQQIPSHLPGALNRAKTEEDRQLVRDCMIAIAAGGPTNSRQLMLNQLSAYWQNDSDQRIRRDLEIASHFSADDVTSQIVSSQTVALVREIQNPTERTRDRFQLLSELKKLLPPNFLSEQLFSALSVSSEPAYEFWQAIINSRREELGQESKVALITRVLELVAMVGNLNQRKPSLLKLATGLLPDVTQLEQSTLTRRVVVEFLWHPDDAIRNSAAGALPLLRKNATLGDLRIHLNAGIYEHLRRVTISSFRQYQPVFDALAANNDLWNESTSRSIAQFAVTLCSDDKLNASALTLLESVSDIDEADRSDVLHVLKNMEISQKNLGDRARALLQRLEASGHTNDSRETD